MPVAAQQFGTGPAVFADSGALSYSGVTFSTLFYSHIHSVVMPDEAGRTTKYVQSTLRAEGVVTLNAGQATIDNQFAAIRNILEQPGGVLIYTGRGYGNLTINAAFKNQNDVCWGPIPKLIDFRPLGGGLSAAVVWECTFCLPENVTPPGARPVLQFNYESVLGYDDEGYASLTLTGTLEIGMTRLGPGRPRDIAKTVDDFRLQWLNIQWDLNTWRVVRRNFHISRDKRVMQWEVGVEELPPMGLPPGATRARGIMSVRQIKIHPRIATGLSWSCSLKCTYTISKIYPARLAAFAFYSLLWFRMWSCNFGRFPGFQQNQADAGGGGGIRGFLRAAVRNPPGAGFDSARFYSDLYQQTAQSRPPIQGQGFGIAGRTGQAFLSDFGFDEGVYLDSKTITFEATWWLLTTFKTLLKATGVWRWPAELGGPNHSSWATSVRRLTGARSTATGYINPTFDVIVDFGGGNPPLPQISSQPGAGGTLG